MGEAWTGDNEEADTLGGEILVDEDMTHPGKPEKMKQDDSIMMPMNNMAIDEGLGMDKGEESTAAIEVDGPSDHTEPAQALLDSWKKRYEALWSQMEQVQGQTQRPSKRQ